MVQKVNNIKFNLPSFTIVAGQSNQGKSYFIFEGVIPKLVELGFEIHWVVNNGFDVEIPIAKQALQYDKYFIHPTSSLNRTSIDNLIEIIRSNDDKKIVIFDNFTYGITGEFLDYVTYARKYNASTIFITHTLFANNKISPRLRELVSYYVFFYLPTSTSYKKIIGDEFYEVYEDNIESKSYKFMIIDPSASQYTIGKLPEYELKFKVVDQGQATGFRSGKILEALRQINQLSTPPTVATQLTTSVAKTKPVVATHKTKSSKQSTVSTSIAQQQPDQGQQTLSAGGALHFYDQTIGRVRLLPARPIASAVPVNTPRT